MLSFSEHRQLYIIEMSQQIGEVDFNFTRHFLERMKLRLGTTMSPDEMVEYLRPILAKVVKKLGDLPVVGEFLFYSKKLGHGIVAAWDAYKRRMSLITFLPKERHQPTKGTQEVVLESILYKIIQLDEEIMKYAYATINGKLVWLKNVTIGDDFAHGIEVNIEGDEIVPKGKSKEGKRYTDRQHILDLSLVKVHPAKMNNTYGELEKV